MATAGSKGRHPLFTAYLPIAALLCLLCISSYILYISQEIPAPDDELIDYISKNKITYISENCDKYNSAPVVVTGIGGSGTRGIAHALLRMNVHMGTENVTLNQAFDIKTSNIPKAVIHVNIRKEHKVITKGILDESIDDFIADTLAIRSERDRERRRGALPTCYWGFKEPNVIYILPHLIKYYPNLTLVHVVRDGRDMAFSENVFPVYAYFNALYPEKPFQDHLHQNQIRLWADVNTQLHGWATANIAPEKYIIVRSDEIGHPDEAIRRPALEEFTQKLNVVLPNVHLTENVVKDAATPIFTDKQAEAHAWFVAHGGAGRRVSSSELSLVFGKWRKWDKTLIRKLEQIAGTALQLFGYKLANYTDEQIAHPDKDDIPDDEPMLKGRLDKILKQRRPHEERDDEEDEEN